MASIPPSGLDLWVTLTEIKIKEVKVIHTYRPLKINIEHKRTELSREI
jgi:hypothetical protein